MENEQSKKVSNEQLLIDIKNTGLEEEAYQKIMDGMAVLMALPENLESGKSSKYQAEYYLYSSIKRQCASFLKQLYALKAERGL